MNEIKLAIIISHPTQYYSPVFQQLAKRLTLKVFFTRDPQVTYDRDFRKHIQWDIPLLEGYDYQYVSGDCCPALSSFKANRLLIYGWAHTSHLRILMTFHRKIPVYFRGDSNLLSKSSLLKKGLRMLVLKWVYRHVDIAFFTGKANKAYFLKYGLNTEQLKFAPHSVDNDRFKPRAENQQQAHEIRRKLGIGNAQTLILFAGKFTAVKNPMLLLKAFIAAAIPHTALLLVGNGLCEGRLKNLAKNHPESNIHFLPFQNQSQMPAIYQACDLFCMPSLHETWGLAINEAMASGKPILSSERVGCAPDLLQPDNSLVFKHNSLTDLRRCLTLMAQDKSGLRDQGMSSFKLISSWTIKKQVNCILYGIQ